MPDEKKQFIRVSHATEERRYWAERPYVSDDLREKVLAAEVLLVPEEGFRDRTEPLFPTGTADLFQFIQDHKPDDLKVEICVSDDNYKELALHSALLIFCTFLATAVAVPVLVNLISKYLEKRLALGEAREAPVRLQLKIADARGISRVQLEFEGPANSFQAEMTEAIRAVALDGGDTVQGALPGQQASHALPPGTSDSTDTDASNDKP